MPIAFQNATTAVISGTSGSISVPSGVANGDFLILAMVCEESTAATTVAGWTQIATVTAAGGLDNLTRAWYRRASSEPGSYTVSISGSYGDSASLAMLRYTGVLSSGSPFRDTATLAAAGLGSPKTSAALTGVQATDLAVHIAGTVLDDWNSGYLYTMAGPGGSWNARANAVASAEDSVPGALVLDQLGTGAAPTCTASGTGIAHTIWNFIAFALIADAPIESPLTLTATGSWTAPAGVSSVRVECWAGGGAGGTATGLTGSSGGGGAGGCYSIRNAYPVIPGASYTVTVGAGGIHTASPVNGAAAPSGGDTWFDSTSGVLAKGGAGGIGRTAVTVGAGATGSSTGCIGDLVYAGGSGAAGTSSIGGGGGGGAGTGGTGGAASGATAGTGRSVGGGSGSAGVSGANASAATTAGGGGGGARTDSGTDRQGGDGARGQVVLTWSDAAPGSHIFSTAVRRASTW